MEKYSLFKIEREFDHSHYLFEDCFEYVETFEDLESAKAAQKTLRERSLIIKTY